MAHMPAAAQFVMWPTAMVGASDQVHSHLQCRQSVSGVPTRARECGQALTHRSIEALDSGQLQEQISVTASRSSL